MKISIVIPVFNSEKTIAPLVEALLAEIGPKYEMEVVLVNDCSQDQSDAVCTQLFERHPAQVRYYALSKNVGEHNAVMAGLNHCTGDIIVTMDDDFQNPVTEVEKLVSTLEQGRYDAVYSVYEEKKHSLVQNLGSWFNDEVANLLLDKPRSLYLSSFRAFNSFVLKQVINYKLPFPYVDGLILRVTRNIGQVKVEHHERTAGQSGYTVRKLIHLWLNMFTNFSVYPLRISVFLGFLFAGFGLLLGLSTMIEKIMNPSIPVGYTSLMVSVAILSGVQLITIGLVGEYLGRIFISLNGQPQYTIRKKFEPPSH